MAVNPTYKHLEASLRLGPFSLGQWAQIMVAVVLALVFAVYLSPLPVAPTVFFSIVLAGSPLAMSYGAMQHEWSVTDAVRAQWQWLRRPRAYLPGASLRTTGYVVLPSTDRERPNLASGGATTTGSREPSGDHERGILWDL